MVWQNRALTAARGRAHCSTAARRYARTVPVVGASVQLASETAQGTSVILFTV
jgi:hypothetical protein